MLKTVDKTKYSSCDNCKKEFKRQSATIWTKHVEQFAIAILKTGGCEIPASVKQTRSAAAERC